MVTRKGGRGGEQEGGIVRDESGEKQEISMNQGTAGNEEASRRSQ